jgi:hypothetical protein
VSDPFDALSSAEVATLLVIAAGATVSWWGLFAALKTPQTPRGLLDLQLAMTRDRAQEIRDAWKAGRRLGAARNSVLLDLPFIAFYVCTLATAGVLGARAAHAEGVLDAAAAHSFATVLVCAALAAGALDCFENAGLQRMLDEEKNDVGAVAAPVTGVAAWLKLALIIGCALTALLALGVSAVAWAAIG